MMARCSLDRRRRQPHGLPAIAQVDKMRARLHAMGKPGADGGNGRSHPPRGCLPYFLPRYRPSFVWLGPVTMTSDPGRVSSHHQMTRPIQ